MKSGTTGDRLSPPGALSTNVLQPWLDEYCEATVPALWKVKKLEELVDLAKALNSMRVSQVDSMGLSRCHLVRVCS
jgi:hypothetical protein